MSHSDVTEWLDREDSACRSSRAERLGWLVANTSSSKVWSISGGWTNRQLFEEARYSFVYGQFLASAVLGMAFVERTLASLFYASGRDDLEKASGERLVREAREARLISEDEASLITKVRKLRNPLVHFRRPMHQDLPDMRAFHQDEEVDSLVESDAKTVLEVVLRLIDRQSIGSY